MAFINDVSCECAKSELDLFCVPPTQTSVLDGRWAEHSPISSIDSGPVEFFISGSGDEYLDLDNTFISVSGRALHRDGSIIAQEEKLVPMNNFLHSMWSQVDLFLNETMITSPTNNYPYRVYLKTLLSYNKEAEVNMLRLCNLWWADSNTQVNDFESKNEEWKHRHGCVENGKFVNMYGKLHLDLLMQDRYLLNGVDLKIRLNRSSHTFHFLGDSGNCKFALSDVKLYARMLKINPAVMFAHEKSLQKTTVNIH